MLNSDFSGNRQSAILLMDDFCLIGFRFIFVTDTTTMVSTTIIDQNEFIIFKRLSEYAIDTLPEVILYIIDRNNNRYFWIMLWTGQGHTILEW